MMEFWCPQCGGRWDGDLSDDPASPVSSSLALQRRLDRDGLDDMEPLLRNLGVRTLQNINDLNDSDRARLLVKARALYSLYNIWLSPVDPSLLRYFGPRVGSIQGWMPDLVAMPLQGLVPFRCPNTGGSARGHQIEAPAV